MHSFICLFIIGYFAVAGSLTLAQHVPKAETNRLTTSTTVAVIEQSIAKSGDKITLQKYFCGADNTGLRPSYAFKQVASGSKQWVDLAMKLYKYGDAGCGEALNDALGAAMQKQPGNVLPYVGSPVFAMKDEICLPIISGELSDAEQLREIRLTKTALLNVHDKALDKQCQMCMTRVVNYEKKILARMAKKK